MHTVRQQFLMIACCIGIFSAFFFGFTRRNVRPRPLLLTGSHTTPSSFRRLSQKQKRSIGDRNGRRLWSSISPNLFAPPSGSDTPPQPPMVSSGYPGASQQAATVAVPASPVPSLAPIDPLAEYVYDGTVTIDGMMSALIEKRKSTEGWYVRAGETWKDYPIVDVTAQAVTLIVDGKKCTLTKSNAINLVPLQADADTTNSPPAAPTAVQFDSSRIFLNSSGDTAISWIAPAEAAHIKDEMFEGRISAAEGERLLNQGNTATLLIRYTDIIDDINTNFW